MGNGGFCYSHVSSQCLPHLYLSLSLYLPSSRFNLTAIRSEEKEGKTNALARLSMAVVPACKCQSISRAAGRVGACKQVLVPIAQRWR